MMAGKQRSTSPGAFHLPSAFSGFAMGAVLTMLATIMVVDANSPLNGSNAASADNPTYGESLPVDDGLADGPTADAGTQNRPGRGQGRGAGQAGGDESSGPAGDESSGPAGGQSSSGVDIGEGSGGAAGAGGSGACPIPDGLDTPGVTDSEVKFGATVAEHGIAEDFLGEVRLGMEAVAQKVNAQGGICGRKISISYEDDGWDAQTGKARIENLIEKGVFAFAVSPSSEGVNAASQADVFRDKGVPVVGSDGLIRTQYSDPMIWPVATSTTTTAHIMMEEAWRRGARNPAIVFENTYRFGVEGALAFNNAYRRLTEKETGTAKDIPGFYDPTKGGAGSCSKRFCGIPAGDQYSAQAGALSIECRGEPRCDFLVLLLEPRTAQTWMGDPNAGSASSYTYKISAAQPLFTDKFARNCGDACNEMRVWTGYNPPIGQLRNNPNVARYVEDLHGQKSTADASNQFTEGGYLGMQLVVAALEKVGGNLTRENFIQALDSMALDTGLSQPLKWSPGNHFANLSAQAFAIESKDGFKGFKPANDFVIDPWPRQDAG